MNTIVIIGRLTASPELRTSSNGNSYTTFSVAVKRDRDGVDFFDCVAFKKTAEFIEKFFKKGNMIAIKGSMHSEQYEDKAGKKQRVWKLAVDEVSFCESKPAEPKEAVDVQPDDDFPF